MNVGLVVRRLSTQGGTERFTLGFARSLARAGHAVSVFCRGTDVDVDVPGVAVRPLRGWSGRGRVLKAALLEWSAGRVPRGSVDVLLGFLRVPGLDVLRAGGGAHAAAVAGTRLGVADRLELRRDARALRTARAVVFNSEMARQDAWRHHALDPLRTHVVRNGVDLERFVAPVDRAAIRRQHGIPEDAHLFLAVGRNHPKKGYADLLGAARLLAADGHRNFTVVIAGAATGELAGEAEARGVSAHVRLLGPVGKPSLADGLRFPGDELVALYRAADTFVFPSHIETFGIALVEAMAAGLPVITTDGPGCRDIVDGGRWGEMVPVGNSAALAAAMRTMTSRPEELSARAGLARERAQDFSWDRIVDQYIELYRETLSRVR